jgi:hypothetical protein
MKESNALNLRGVLSFKSNTLESFFSNLAAELLEPVKALFFRVAIFNNYFQKRISFFRFAKKNPSSTFFFRFKKQSYHDVTMTHTLSFSSWREKE